MDGEGPPPIGRPLPGTRAYVLDAYEGGLPSASYLGVLADAAGEDADGMVNALENLYNSTRGIPVPRLKGARVVVNDRADIAANRHSQPSRRSQGGPEW